MSAPERIALEILEPVSSLFLAAGYNPDKSILALQFKSSGEIRHYAGVMPDTAIGFYTATSRGRYFHEHIRGRYQVEKMTGPCPACGDGEGWVGDTCTDCGTATYEADPAWRRNE